MKQLIPYLGANRHSKHEHKFTIPIGHGLYRCEHCSLCDDLEIDNEIKRTDDLLASRNKQINSHANYQIKHPISNNAYKFSCPITGFHHCPDGTKCNACADCSRSQQKDLTLIGWIIIFFLLIALMGFGLAYLFFTFKFPSL